MRKNRFFDTIMIALILMIGFKILFPDAFKPAQVTVNAYIEPSDVQVEYVSQGSSESTETPATTETTTQTSEV